MKETFNRWQVLAASTAILLCTGAVYSFPFRWASKFFNRAGQCPKSCSHLQLTQQSDRSP